jgi:hypothetical protein
MPWMSTIVEVEPLEGSRPRPHGRVYTVAVYQFLVAGGNAIQPLLGYVQEHLAVPPEEVPPPSPPVELVFREALWLSSPHT